MTLSSIPWQDPRDLAQAALFFQTVDRQHKNRLVRVREIACEIREHLEALSFPVEQLCSQTCPSCQDNCCERATIWYDFKDLVCLYFGAGGFPARQIYKVRGDSGARCIHLAREGCKLSRKDRPFVCTWYFCPDQKQAGIFETSGMDTTLSHIKDLRNHMETLFCRV